jgi:uncharacterized membrane protein YsdA (DUF1294 family)
MSAPTPGTGSAQRIFAAAVALLGVFGIALVYLANFNSPPIRSDGLGYYLYLPASFLYHDLSLKEIAELFHRGAIPDASPSLWRDSGPLLLENGNYLIKYPMGVAVLMLPFFLVACLISLLFGLPVDGFSPLFQYLAALSGLCYAVAGIVVLWKVLEPRFSQKSILWGMLGVVFATDLFHYATYDSVFSHVYSFFLFSALLYVVQRLYAQAAPRWFLLAGVTGGLIVLTRPTNGLWLVFGLLYGVASRESLWERLGFWQKEWRGLLLALVPLLLVVSLQLCYWKAVTGQWVTFSYRGERFYFGQPEVFNVLFSVRKGLFFWAPFLLTLFPGLYYVRKRTPEYLIPILVFLPLNVYVVSSWHSWFYGGSFGHRAFIESFPLFAVCFCSWYDGIASRAGKAALAAFTCLCVALSSWLMLKYWTGVIPFDGTTWEYFAATFWNLTK